MIARPKGTQDVLPRQSYQWHILEGICRDTAKKFNFKEIRTPVFEHTELFLRGIGDTTDIVNKEMYTFLDKGERSITLKPEGTASVARAFIENSLYGGPMPVKMYYITPVFRYEKPQAGRLREHHQFGIELYGADTPEADVEVIAFADSLLKSFGLRDKADLNINNIGCPECRKKYHSALTEYLAEYKDSMCKNCIERLEKNPLRVLDCKEESCQGFISGAPEILDYLCDTCADHHSKVCGLLDAADIHYRVNPKIVRGLDYYTGTVFEFISGHIGAQGTVCAGGRYNNLVAEVGGKPCPAVGFGLGLERILLLMENIGLLQEDTEKLDAYIVCASDTLKSETIKLAGKLRGRGYSVDFDALGRSMKAQMKQADKSNALSVIIIGDEEHEKDGVTFKFMDSTVEPRQVFTKIDGIAELIDKARVGNE